MGEVIQFKKKPTESEIYREIHGLSYTEKMNVIIEICEIIEELSAVLNEINKSLEK